jgi:hypothetical protein
VAVVSTGYYLIAFALAFGWLKRVRPAAGEAPGKKRAPATRRA